MGRELAVYGDRSPASIWMMTDYIPFEIRVQKEASMTQTSTILGADKMMGCCETSWHVWYVAGRG